jgi:dCTP deaminase
LLVIGEHLKVLLEQHHVVSDPNCFDNNSLSLSLSPKVIFMERNKQVSEITYGQKIPDECLRFADITDHGIVIPAKGGFLGASLETVSMPLGYFGLLTTKGSFARLLAAVNCCDGQIEAGFRGKITFEIVNLSSLDIRVLPRQKIAQLFIFETSMRDVPPYNGRYQFADGPTIQKPEP